MKNDLLSRSIFKFNTLNTISVYGGSEDVLDDVAQLCQRYESLFSRTDPSSALFRVNHAQGAFTDVDPELAELVRVSLDYCERSGGLFDVTMGSVVGLWDFKQGVIPDEQDVLEALRHVDYRGVEVDGTRIRLADPEATLDLGGIAKGYIADGILNLLADREVTGGIVNLGGNVAVFGEKPDGTAWNVGIRSPAPLDTSGIERSFSVLSVREGSVVTSGIYERAFERGGVVYHHILDPHTGHPAQTDVISATIVAEKSLDADGFTTSLVLMGADRALEFAENEPKLEAVLVTADGAVYATSRIGSEIPFQLLKDER